MAEQPQFATKPFYWAQSTEPILIYDGAIELSKGDKTATHEGFVDLLWTPKPWVEFRAYSKENSLSELLDVLDPGETTVRLVDVVDEVPLQQGNERREPEPPWSASRRSSLRQHVLLPDAKFTEVVFNLINFPGPKLGGFVADKETNEQHRRTTLKSGQWVVTLDERPDYLAVEQSMRESGGYAFTHVGRLSRKGGQSFDWKDAKKVLDVVFRVTSFARGKAVGPALPVGLDADNKPVFAAWFLWLNSTWGNDISWWSRDRPGALQTVFDALLKAKGTYLGDVLNRAIRLYLDANDPSSIDTGLVMAQSGLELLTWAVLVEQEGWLLPKDAGVGGLRASAKLRLLLQWAQIPTDVPSELPELAKRATAEKGGPECLTEARNAIIHPTRLDRLYEQEELVEALRLATWYFELLILRICGYDGEYENRLSPSGWAGDLDWVPWKQSPDETVND